MAGFATVTRANTEDYYPLRYACKATKTTNVFVRNRRLGRACVVSSTSITVASAPRTTPNILALRTYPLPPATRFDFLPVDAVLVSFFATFSL